MRTPTLLFVLTATLFACNFGGGGRYHPNGWSIADQHGAATKLGEQECTTCHGETLEGGDGSDVSCDDCHADGWRTDCTFCHGGEETMTGGPPDGIDDTVDPASLPFAVHTSHVENDKHPNYDCVQCHTKPTDVLTPGHLFHDDTPAVAEVVFDEGLSYEASWDGAGTCSSTYCHGNGRVTADVDASTDGFDCTGCHAGRSVGLTWLQMSGVHGEHLFHGIGCETCHAGTVDGADAIVDADLHVNGEPDVAFASDVSMTYDGTCTGTCHSEVHTGRSW